VVNRFEVRAGVFDAGHIVFDGGAGSFAQFFAVGGIGHGGRAARQYKRLGQIQVVVAQGQVFVFVLGEVAVEIVCIMRRGGGGVVDKSFGGVARIGF
jgi:hypothetical protein